jgi:hypothetical protein
VTWLKLNDGLYADPKIVEVGYQGGWLHVCALSYCSQHMTDGVFPKAIVPRLSDAPRAKELARALVEVGLWADVGAHYEIVGYLDEQRSAEQIEAERAKERAKKARARKGRANVPEGIPEGIPEGVPKMSRVTETETELEIDTNPKTSLSEVLKNNPPNTQKPAPKERAQAKLGQIRKPLPSVAAGSNPEAERLCFLLAGLVEANGAKRPAITRAWLDAARLLLEQDRRPLEEAERVLRWSQADSFWRANVLSLPKFRAKYDQLRLRELDARSKVPDVNQDWTPAERGLT